MSQHLPSIIEDFSGWYNEVVVKADLVDNPEKTPVKGCMIIKPYGYEIWEAIKSGLDQRFKNTGHSNAYFPLFIPMSFLEKEAEHVEGFAPELAVVTHAGGKELEEPYVIRPTSETIIGEAMSRWIQSYRDLPLLLNQWANVVRWEKRTRPFLRTSEFLWQEGHTAHATYEDAQYETLQMLDIYEDFALREAAIPVIKGQKSNQERFAGALASYTIEAMMGDGKALQAGTSHNLGQNFAKALNIMFTDENNQIQHCWTTSWGVSTRMIGAVIMTHGDEKGLRLPPRLAPIQVVIVPIYRSDAEKDIVAPIVQEVKHHLNELGIRTHIDYRENVSPGFKYNDWEMRGVPIRIEVGPNDVRTESVTLSRRDSMGVDRKIAIEQSALSNVVLTLLEEIQKNLLGQALSKRDSRIHEVVADYQKFLDILRGGEWAFTWFSGEKEAELKIKEDAQAVSRCFPLDQPYFGQSGPCIVTGELTTRMAYFAKAY